MKIRTTYWISLILLSIIQLVSCEQKKVNPPTLGIDGEPQQLTFASSVTDQSFSIKNTGGGDLTWTASADKSWIQVSPSQGTNTGTVYVTVDKQGLQSGNQSGIVQVKSNGGDRTIRVSMTVGSPILSVSPASLNFGTSTSQMQVNVANTGEGKLTWSATSNRNWLTITYPSDPNASNFTVNVNRNGLSAGTQTGSIAVTSNGGSVEVPVTVTVDQPAATLAVSPANLSFGTTSTEQTLSLSNSGGGTLTWSVSSNPNWLSASPTSGSNNGTVTVRVNRSGLASGSYTGSIQVTSNGGTSTIPVTMSIPTVQSQPILSISPSSLNFGGTTTQLTLSVANTGTGTLNWTATDDRSWLTVSPASGSTGTMTVNVSRSGLAEGSYSGTISVASNGGSATIPVTMVVNPTTGSATLIFENTLIEDINVSVNGTVVGSVPAGETRNHTVSGLTNMTVGFAVLSEQNGGEPMAGVFSAVSNPSGSYRFTIDNVIGSQYYFAPLITNNGGSRLLVGVNMGLQSEKRTNRVAPATTKNVYFGYFRGYSNSNVRAFKEGSNYSGTYLYWNAGSQFNVTKGSGAVNLTATSSLREGVSEATTGTESGTTYRLGGSTNSIKSSEHLMQEDREWNAPATLFRRAKLLGEK
ncbi:hypothetical protein GCM10027592_22250 [Spirosoma flavus]